MKAKHVSDERKLYDLCKEFIEEQFIHDKDDAEWVTEDDKFKFIMKVCEIIGFKELVK
ncbi:hypothetical protein EVB96_030 [Rhizobium phage RHph_TM3_3_6]|nr:hypothetical protein EVB96_030 [Rhizobium phage RHph_TM3_3_6]QIG77617.1 hypothetical protein EVB64_030 [Rhizobium phage RHph_TM61]